MRTTAVCWRLITDHVGLPVVWFRIRFVRRSIKYNTFKNESSIRTLVDSSSYSFIEVLRGPNSFGTLLDSLGFKSVPSVNDPGPGGMRYFSGGYNTARHGSRDGGMISAIQIEAPKPGIRQNQQTWSNYASALATVVDEYYFRHLKRRIKD